MISLRESGGDKAGRGQHAHMLGLYIDEVLKENELEPAALDAVAVGQGPGSYTGLRIGVSTAKGLCYGLQKPLIAVDSLKALANIAMEEYEAGIIAFDDPAETVLAPMIDARRMEVYTRLFDTDLNPLSETEAHIITPESFAGIRAEEKALLVFGNGSLKSTEVLPWVRWAKIASSARGMVTLAEKQFQQKEFSDTAYFEPFYLKDFVAIKGAPALEKLSRK